MKLQTIKIIKLILLILFALSSVVIGILLYKVFIAYDPRISLNQLFKTHAGLSAFQFLGVSAGLLITFPVLIVVFEVYARFSSSYIHIVTEKGDVLLSDNAISSFIHDTVTQVAGVEDVTVSINIMKHNVMGIDLWIDTDEKNDFLRFSERIQQRVLQDLEFNFSVEKIKFFNVYLESTNIDFNSKVQKVEYK